MGIFDVNENPVSAAMQSAAMQDTSKLSHMGNFSKQLNQQMQEQEGYTGMQQR